MDLVMQLDDISTPALLLDRTVLERNCHAMGERATLHGVALRPHLKTAKCAEVAAIATAGHFGGITVSTLAEAGFFAAAGVTDITYAVGMVPSKVPELAALQRGGASIKVLTDSVDAVRSVNEAAALQNVVIELLIEIDTGGRRGGVEPDSDALLQIARAVDDATNLDLLGVLTHGGHSYHCKDVAAIREVAEQERSGVIRAAERIREAGFDCHVVSAGSTPTAVHAQSFDGLTEIRPGVYMLNDLDQVGLGSCGIDDIAASVLATVIGHNRAAGRILIDAGALALSKDVSATEFMVDVGYGLVCRPDGSTIAGLYVADVHQEHGLIGSSTGVPDWSSLPIGSRVRILPNHVCMTAAAYGSFAIVDQNTSTIVATWPRVNGW
jgi:D-serine deaminase-like pyridoxal phosphate-dependent protein